MLAKLSHTIFLILSLLALSCTKQQTNRNPYLQEVRFSTSINLSLPSYNNLTAIGNPIYINETGVGTRGIFVMNVGFNQFRAFEATCPNHIPNSCSVLKLNGQNGSCDCDDLSYSFLLDNYSTDRQKASIMTYWNITLNYREMYLGYTTNYQPITAPIRKFLVACG